MPNSLSNWLRLRANRCEYDMEDDDADKCREAAERIELLQSENAKLERLAEAQAQAIDALTAKLNPPWLEKPASEGIWWNDKEKRFFDVRYAGGWIYRGVGGRWISVPSGRWSRAILPENPQ